MAHCTMAENWGGGGIGTPLACMLSITRAATALMTGVANDVPDQYAQPFVLATGGWGLSYIMSSSESGGKVPEQKRPYTASVTVAVVTLFGSGSGLGC